MSISAARSRVNMVKEYLDKGRLDQVESTLATAEKYLEGQPDGDAAPVRAEIAALRAQFEAMPSEQESRSIGAAKRDVKAVRTRIEERQLLGVEDIVKRAAKYVADVRPQHRAEIDAEIAAASAELQAAIDAAQGPAKPATPTAPPPAAAPATTVTASASAPTAPATPAPVAAPVATAPAPTGSTAPRQLTDDEYSLQSRLRGNIRSVSSRVESGRTDGALEELDEIAPQLAGLPEFAVAPFRTQIEEIRALYHKTVQAELVRKVRSELDRYLHAADSNIERMDWHDTREKIAHVKRRLGDDDAKRALTPDDVAAYEQRMVAIETRLTAFIKADALDRTGDLIIQLEQDIESNPFNGLDEYSLHSRKSSLDHLRWRVIRGIDAADPNDPDIAAIAKRVSIVDQKIEKALLAWGKAKLDANVSNNWASIEKDIEGWQHEQDTHNVDNLDQPNLPKTSQAVQRTRWLLESQETKNVRASHPDDPAIQGPFQIAERTFRDAAAKLAEAFSRIIAHAETFETPLSHFVLCRPNLLAYAAESELAGTSFQQAVVGRARVLDERWKTEVAAIYKARQDLYDRLAADAEKTWPQMRDAIDAMPFNPHTARSGMTVRLDAVYNRAGWDYGSRAYSFAVRREGVVLGGVYEKHVLDALEHAWYHLKLDVGDRIPWDLIAVIEGPDKIGVRTNVTLRDKLTGEKLGELEEWPPIDCLRIRIIGLHAGPVAVTPGSAWAPQYDMR